MFVWLVGDQTDGVGLLLLAKTHILGGRPPSRARPLQTCLLLPVSGCSLDSLVFFFVGHPSICVSIDDLCDEVVCWMLCDK